MSEMTIASAIVVADIAEDQETNHNPLKRRQSDAQRKEEEQGGKRPRISPGKNSPSPQATIRNGAEDQSAQAHTAEQNPTEQQSDTRPPRRQNSVADEKQRSKRLFGALLGNLNQPGDRTSKRRQEIESRRKAELQRQDDERVEDDLRREEKRAEVKRRDQVGIDRHNMRVRHANILHAANFLQTVAEPRLYYRPWELRPDEEDRIEQQTKDAQARIDQEVEDFDQQHTALAQTEREQNGRVRESIDLTGQAERKESEDHDRTPAEPVERSKPVEAPDTPSPSEPADIDTTNDIDGEPDSAAPVDKGQNEGDESEDQAEHVVDAGEDTVIY